MSNFWSHSRDLPNSLHSLSESRWNHGQCGHMQISWHMCISWASLCCTATWRAALTCWVPVTAECSCVVWVLRAKTKQTLGCGSKGMAHRSREDVTALYSALVGPHLDQMLCRSLGSPILKGLGIVQESLWRAINLARWLIHGRWGEAERAKLVCLVKDTNISYVFMIVGSEDPRNCASLTVGNKSLDRFCLPVTEHLRRLWGEKHSM